MSKFIYIFTLCIRIYNLINMLLFQDILILSSLELFRCINEQNISWIAVSLAFQHQYAHRDSCSVEQICRQSDNSIQTVQIFDDIFSDCFFCTTTEQYTMWQQHSYTTIRIIHVINHMFYKGKVSSRLRCQLSSSAVSWVILKFLISWPLQAIRWIADLYSQLQIITVFIIFQRISFVDVKILPVYTMHNHVHSW